VQEECEIMPEWAVRAGARERIYFDPRTTIAALVTCGGLCPGLNDVVQGLVKKLEDYGVPEGKILGIRCASTPAPVATDTVLVQSCCNLQFKAVGCNTCAAWVSDCWTLRLLCYFLQSHA
jgi:hypothetical protein